MIKVLLVVVVLAALVYGVVWAIERRRTLGRIRPRPKPRMIAPDDDEDFLRSLRHEQETEQEPGEDDGPDMGEDKGEKRP